MPVLAVIMVIIFINTLTSHAFFLSSPNHFTDITLLNLTESQFYILKKYHFGGRRKLSSSDENQRLLELKTKP